MAEEKKKTEKDEAEKHIDEENIELLRAYVGNRQGRLGRSRWARN